MANHSGIQVVWWMWLPYVFSVCLNDWLTDWLTWTIKHLEYWANKHKHFKVCREFGLQWCGKGKYGRNFTTNLPAWSMQMDTGIWDKSMKIKRRQAWHARWSHVLEECKKKNRKQYSYAVKLWLSKILWPCRRAFFVIVFFVPYCYYGTGWFGEHVLGNVHLLHLYVHAYIHKHTHASSSFTTPNPRRTWRTR